MDVTASAEVTPFELSSSQINIWNAERAYSGTSINTICATIRINGTLDIAAIQKSLNAVLKRESQLRTRVTLVNGNPCQYVAPYEHTFFPVFDFTKTDRDGLEHWESAVTRESMPLLDAPLAEFRIFKQNESEGGILVKTHHIISDGWSQVLLSNRIAQTYFALISGAPDDAPASPGYRLHIEKENAYLKSAAHEKDARFWRERLAQFEGASAVKDCLSAAVSPVGRRKTYRLSHVLNHAIHDFCDKYRVAPFAVYYMALAVFLQRSGAGRRSSIGVPVFNRADFADKNTPGMFVSTLPFIGEIDENWSFERFNHELAEQWFELLRHQRLPFSEITELAKDIAPEAGSLFHIVLSYQTSRIYKSADASVTFSGRWHYSGYQSEHLLIHLSSMEDDYRFSVDYDYLTQIFSEQDIDRLHGYLVNILTAALGAPETPIWKLPITGMDERERVLFTFNQTTRPLPYADVPAMLLDGAAANAHRAAIICTGRRLTYGALITLAGSYARAIESVCGKPDSVIAICLEKGFELAASMTGAILSGNTWLTLPSDTPPGRLNEILEDCGASVLICEHTLVPPGCRCAALSPAECERFPGEGYEPKPAAHTAYLVYTSGSTGKPKGVMIGQESLVNLAMALRRLYGHGAVLSLCSTGFDVFVMECAVSLMNSRTIVFPSTREQEDPRALASLIRDYAVGNMALPPSRLEAYMKSAEFTRAIASVEKIICGGEHFPGELMQTLRQYTDASVYNQYGPSETTVAISWKLLNDASAITIGAPMENCRLYVLDAHLQPLPVGIYGEIYIGGVCVGQGYLNRDELTAASFIKSPFEPGETLYRTGDTGCWTHEGEILLGGRIDSQVKLRGLRIEPQEIAMRISAHEKVDQAAVRIIRRDKSAFIAAYYTSRANVSEAELAAFASLYLPGYMLPGAYIRVEEMPVTRSGKIDVSALPDPVISAGGEGANSIEAELLEVFRATLKKPDMGVESDYFLCGGDSLTAMEAITAIEARLGVKLCVADIFTLRTARRLAGANAFINTENAPVRASSLIEKAPAREYYPATPTQVSLYFEAASAPGSTAYNMPGAFRLPAAADKAKLCAALRELIRRESILRTGLEITEQGVCQRVYPNAAFSIEELANPTFDDAAREFIRPFDISRPPLMRAAFWNSPEGERYLFFDTHHLIGDGLTSPLLMKKLDAIYSGAPDDGGIRFADYAVHSQSAPLDPDAYAYWKTALENMPEPPDIPFDAPAASYKYPCPGKKLVFTLAEDTAKRVNEAAAAGEYSPFMLFLSAYALFIAKLTGAWDITVGTPVAGRTAQQLWDVCGPFIHALPLRLRLDRCMSARELLDRVKREVLGVSAAQDIPLNELMKLAHGEKGGSLFNTLFAMRPIGDGDFSFLGETLKPIAADTGCVKFPLSIEAARENGKWSFTLEYASGLIEDETAALWARSYAALLYNMLSSKEAALDALDPLDPQDRYYLFDKADRLRAPFADVPIDIAVLSALARRGEGEALRYHTKGVTGRELATRATQIAKGIVALGAKPGDTVGVALSRTPELIAALIGILAAGCAYMPALPSCPEKRMAEMAESASIRLLLAEGGDVQRLSAAMPCPACDVRSLRGNDIPLPTLEQRRGANGMYVLFTSGTTGKPKGARVNHTAIANLTAVMEGVLDEGVKSVLCATNAVFDIFTTESLIALALGKRVILADEEEMLPPHALAELIEHEGADAMQLTPSRLRVCLANDAFKTAAKRLRVMLTAGEALPEGLAKRFFECGEGRLYNLYGPTETSVYATYCECARGGGRISIGRPLVNCRGYVLDEHMNRVMPTARGELYISGICVGDGYINAPELTKACFIDDPFFPGEVMYKSGDAARMRADGAIEYLGRLDTQLKLNGQRVEPLEISARISNIPGVAEAVVVAVDSGNNLHEKHLRACVVREAASHISPGDVLGRLSAELPPYMLPTEIVFMDELPKNASGKTDIQALAALALAASTLPSSTLPASPEPPVPPAPAHTSVHDEAASPSSVRGALKSAWRQALGREDIDAQKSFFEQGGGSLAAIDAISRIYGAGHRLTISQFYANPTIAAQEALLLAADDAAASVNIRADSTVATAVEKESSSKREGAIMLTGATGYLGAHMLDELVRAMGRSVVCVLRGGDKERLGKVMDGYFNGDWMARYGANVSAVAGDMQQPRFGIPEQDIERLAQSVTTLVHCAADTRHYAADEQESIRANAGGAANAVKLAAALNARLAYISTVSVAGDNRRDTFTEADMPADPATEKNVYVRGKCAAELIVRRCANMLPGTVILRVGRLVGRNRDGVFQRNKDANSFYTFVRGALMLEKFPESACDIPVELTPVDECARAASLLITRAEGNFKNYGETLTYHVYDPVMPCFGEIMRTLGRNGPFVPDGEFDAYLAGLIAKQPCAELVMLSEMWDMARNALVQADASAAVKALRAAGFIWQRADIRMALKEYIH